MDIYQKNRIYFWLIIFLLVISLGAHAFYLISPLKHKGRPPGKEHEMKDERDFLKSELGLKSEQEKPFTELKEKFLMTRNFRFDSMMVLKLELKNESFSEKPDSVKINNICERLGNQRKFMEIDFANHIKEVKKILTKEQFDKFRIFIEKSIVSDHQEFDDRLSKEMQNDPRCGKDSSHRETSKPK